MCACEAKTAVNGAPAGLASDCEEVAAAVGIAALVGGPGTALAGVATDKVTEGGDGGCDTADASFDVGAEHCVCDPN